MSYKDLPDDLKQKLFDEINDSTSGGDEKLLILEKQNSFVEEFIRKRNINIRFDGKVDWREAPGITKDVFITKIEQEYRLYAAKFKIASPNRLKRPDLLNQFNELLYDHKAEKLFRLENTLRHRKECKGELDRFIRALFPSADKEKFTFAKKVFESFIWQVKRKVAGLPVEHHIMPVLYSKQHGTGKSISVDRLVRPLYEFTLHAQLDIFRDPFFRKSFGDHFICVFDELQGAGRTDIESMKNIITAATVSARGMRTQDVDTITQNCTFIGTTNKPIAELIFDNTGMRRFVELELEEQADLSLITGEKWVNVDRKKVDNKIDFLKVWQGVSEIGLNPIFAVREQLELHQEGLRTKSTVEQWIEEHDINVGEVPNDIRVLYNHYVKWMDMQKKSIGMISKFAKDLEGQGYEVSERKSLNGVRTRWVYLSEEFLGLKV